MIRFSLLASVAALCLSLPAATAHAQDAQDKAESFGGAKGADMSIAATQPDGAKVTIGQAGDYPADIARFLLAGGAGAAALSPDGTQIAFAWDITGQNELWIMPATGGTPRQLTFRTGVAAPVWTPDGTALFYSADRDGNEQPGYFAITADGSKETSVLPAQRGDFRSFGDFAADGSYVYASTARGTGVFDIYRGTLGGKSELIVQSELGLVPQSVSPDGKYALVTEIVGEDADNLYLLDLSTKTMKPVAKPPVAQRASHTLGGFAWTPDSAAVYFSSNEGREFGALTRYEVASGRLEVIAPGASASADVENVQLCGAAGEYLFWTENRDGFDTLKGWNRAANSALAMPALPEGKYGLDCEGAPARLLVRVNGWATPGALWTIDPAAGTAREVFAANLAGLDPARLIRPQVVRYTARDGVELQGLLYLPVGAKRGAEAPPVLFAVHGGPSGQSMTSFDAVAQYHAGRGVAVFAPNVRGSTGLGRTYSTLDDREKRLASVRDLVDLKAALAASGLIDGKRAAVMGGSYGGYMVNAVLAEYPGEFAAGVALFGVADWITALEIASPALKASDRIEYGDITEARWREFYKVNSPIRKADRITVPVLYSHGIMDPRIDIYETEVMVKTLRANGIEAPFIRIPDEGHGWRKLENQLFYFRKQAEFVERQLGLGAGK
jgi:dipeptidyl aminopeptidase/acylaminoacyl peptidase